MTRRDYIAVSGLLAKFQAHSRLLPAGAQTYCSSLLWYLANDLADVMAADPGFNRSRFIQDARVTPP